MNESKVKALGYIVVGVSDVAAWRFDDAALQALRNTLYTPVYKIRPSHVPVLFSSPADRVRIRKYFRFRLHNESGSPIEPAEESTP